MLAGCSGDDESSQCFVNTCRETIREQLDVEPTRLAVVSGTVELGYASSYENEAGELGYEIGFISGRFGRQVADGWDVDRLSARAEAADDRTLTWSLSAETGRAFANDKITTAEFISRIFDDLTVEWPPPSSDVETSPYLLLTVSEKFCGARAALTTYVATRDSCWTCTVELVGLQKTYEKHHLYRQ